MQADGVGHPDGSGGAMSSDASQDQLPVVPGSAKYDDKLAQSLHGDTVSAPGPLHSSRLHPTIPTLFLTCRELCTAQHCLHRRRCRRRLHKDEPSQSCSFSVL